MIFQYREKEVASESTNRELEEKNTALETEIGSLKEALEDRDEKNKVETCVLRSEMKDLQDKLDSTVMEMQTNHCQELEAVRQEHDKLLDNLKRSHQDEISGVEKQVQHLN